MGGLYCTPELFDALDGLDFPASKEQVISYATEHNAPEAVSIALNDLPGGVLFESISAICENVSIICSLEVYRALEGIRFPATKAELLAYAVGRDGSENALAALRALAPRHKYLSINEVCRNVVDTEDVSVPPNVTVTALFENGAFRPLEDVPLPDGWRVRLIVEPLSKA